MDLNKIFRNINKRTILNQDKVVSCPICAYPISDDWITDNLNEGNWKIYYKHTTTETNIKGEKVEINKYLKYQAFDGQ